MDMSPSDEIDRGASILPPSPGINIEHPLIQLDLLKQHH